MSPQGIGELYKSIVDASPEIKGIIVTVNEECEFPSTYRVRVVDDISDFSG